MPHAQPKRPPLIASFHRWGAPDRWGLWCLHAFTYEDADWRVFEGESGAFAFAKSAGRKNDCPCWELLYVDQAEHLDKALPNHPKWAEAKKLGATHVVIKFLPQDCIDGGKAESWIRHYYPPLNPPAEPLEYHPEKYSMAK